MLNPCHCKSLELAWLLLVLPIASSFVLPTQQQPQRSAPRHYNYNHANNKHANCLYPLHSSKASAGLSTGTRGDVEDFFYRAKAKAAFDKFDPDGSGGICLDKLTGVLRSLDLGATAEEANALFLYLDRDGDGSISLEEFLPWYGETVETAIGVSRDFQSMLLSRRTVNRFDPLTPISDAVLKRAIRCAIAAPNRSGSEPWSFTNIGPKTVQKLQALNVRVVMAGGDKVLSVQQQAPLLPEVWTEIPGWCVVTTKLSPSDPVAELRDFRSTCCAIQNFMLSMWSEGVGSKWTEGATQKTQQFADICGVDTSLERVVGIIWYGFPASDTVGLNDEVNNPKTQRKKGVNEVLKVLP